MNGSWARPISASKVIEISRPACVAAVKPVSAGTPPPRGEQLLRGDQSAGDIRQLVAPEGEVGAGDEGVGLAATESGLVALSPDNRPNTSPITRFMPSVG